MVKRSFLRRYIVYSLKYFFDLSYLLIIFLISICISILEVFYAKYKWNESLLSYNINSSSLNLLDSFYILLVVLIISLTTFFIFRFFTNFLLFNSKKILQELVAIFIGLIYLYVSIHGIFKIGYNPFFIEIQGKILNFIVIVFFVFSFFYYIFQNKLFYINQSLKKIFLFFTIFIFIFLDWFIVNYYKNQIESKLGKNEFSLIFYNLMDENKNKLISHYNFQEIKNYQDFFKNKKNPMINNIGDPNSFFKFESLNLKNSTCQNSIMKIKKYNLYKYFLPLLNFIPNRILVLYFHDLYCLNLGANYSELFRYNIYNNILNSTFEESNNISIINASLYNLSGDALLNQIEILFNTFPEIKNRSHFYYENHL